jgi:hypothetical protein
VYNIKANDPESGLTQEVIESPYLLDRFVKEYSNRRKESKKEGKMIHYG